MTIWIGLPYPIPGKTEPLIAFGFGHQGKPGDFILTPDKWRWAGLSRIVTPKIIELDQIGQMLTSPATGRDATFAALEN